MVTSLFGLPAGFPGVASTLVVLDARLLHAVVAAGVALAAGLLVQGLQRRHDARGIAPTPQRLPAAEQWVTEPPWPSRPSSSSSLPR